MKNILFCLSVILVSAVSIMADNTLRGNKLKAMPEALNPAMAGKITPIVTDTLREPENTVISLSGYDKPLRTSRETFLVTNNGEKDMLSMAVTIDYMDMEGRQLHQRTDTIDARVPAGETRMLRLSTWDSQHSYYYHLGQKPRTSNVTPYRVKARVEFVTIIK